MVNGLIPGRGPGAAAMAEGSGTPGLIGLPPAIWAGG